MTEEKLLELGIKLPQVAKPLAAYTPALKVGNLVITSGQVPVVDGAIMYKGKLGKELSEDEGKKAAEICALNCLAAVKSVIEDLDKISRVVKLVVFVASAEGFVNQPEVANGASELIGKIFGEAGKHTRSAVGVAELPKGAAVEIEMIVELKG